MPQMKLTIQLNWDGSIGLRGCTSEGSQAERSKEDRPATGSAGCPVSSTARGKVYRARALLTPDPAHHEPGSPSTNPHPPPARAGVPLADSGCALAWGGAAPGWD